MDRDELDARIRQRRPGEVVMRRGVPIADGRDTRQAGYVRFEPEPEDASAVREPDAAPPAPHVDNMPADVGWPRQHVPEEAAGEPYQPQRETYREEVAEPEQHEPEQHEPEPYEPDQDEPEADDAAGYDQQGYLEPEAEPYGAPEDAYPYPHLTADDRRRPRTSALPIIGFILLCVLALGVGAALAGMLGGDPGIADASPTATLAESLAPSEEPTPEPTDSAAEQPSATPEPTDGPVTFPDGAVIQVQPCATQGMTFDGCQVDGSTIDQPTMWVWIGFDDAQGTDTFVLTLRSAGQTIDQQEKLLGDVLDCPGSCSGYLIGAAYRDLEPGDYELVVRRNDDFADSATFTVEG
jgi:hypothetical protein